MPWFPFFVQLDGAPGLVVGGGRVACHKVDKLLPYGPRLTVVAPDICADLADRPGLTLHRRPFAESDLAPAPLFVIAATGDRAFNRHIAALCRARRILVNVVDDPAGCGFYFPSLVRRGRLSIGISTGGASPTAAAWLRGWLERNLPPQLEAVLDRLAARRGASLQAGSGEPETVRARRFRADFECEMAAASALPGAPPAGQVALVGAGCGPAEWITVRGLRLLQQCRAIVYDDLIDPALLDEVPAGAERHYVGKRSGRHAMPQAQINDLLIELAGHGGLVVRLKGGDPYLFGRGGEEVQALHAAGVPCEVVPGIPSAIAVPGQAGIPVTQRGVSRAVHIITAHGAGAEPPDYRRYAALDGTLVFLMGLHRLPQIADGLMAGGLPGDTPAAVVSGGNAPHPATVRAALRDIAGAAKTAGVETPAVIVIGGTAALDLPTVRPDGE